MDKEFKNFSYLNISGLMGVINDNLFKLLLVFFLIDRDGEKSSSAILALVGAIFVLPFLLFSVLSGSIADKISKQKIIFGIKVAELFTSILGVLAFAFTSPFLLYLTLFFRAIEGATIGPSKYSIVPELVPPDKLSKANGLLSFFTFLGIIIGTSLAGPLIQLTNRSYPLASSFCIILSLIGLLFSIKIPLTKAANSSKPLPYNFVLDIFKTYRKALKTKNLLTSILGAAFFLFIGGFTQLNIIPFTIHTLKKSDIIGSYIFLLTALGIGGGSLLAGKILGKKIKLQISPWGGLGISLCFISLGALEPSLIISLLLLLLLGFFGGLYLVPFDSYIQAFSPPKECGQNVAANNFTGFVGVLGASGLIYLFAEVFHITPATGFIIVGVATLIITVALALRIGK
ncbi:MAG: MFS transporter [Chlamydiae bacterium]|nr:MFS transporter [Chlamydiota bacterium]